MGPEPIPELDIELPAIQNDLQRKMVEEIRCVMCNNFPYDPKECKHCSKLFCKFCQLILIHDKTGNAMQHDGCDLDDPEMRVKMAKMSAEERDQVM